MSPPTTSADKSDNVWILKRLAKFFDDKLYFGFVTEYHPAAADSDNKIDTPPDLWEVIYDDGDSEDLELAELKQCQQVLLQNEAKDPQSLYLGRRVAQIFYDEEGKEEELEFGTVDEFVPAHETGESKVWYRVVYDDERTGVEDVSTSKLRTMLILYNKNKDADSRKQDEEEAAPPQILSASLSTTATAVVSATLARPASNLKKPPARRITPSPVHERTATTCWDSGSDFSEGPPAPVASPTISMPAAATYASRNDHASPPTATQVLDEHFALLASNGSSFGPHMSVATAASAAIAEGEGQHSTTEQEEAIATAIVSAEQEENAIDWKQTQKELDDAFEVQSREKMLSLPDSDMPSQFKNNANLTLFDYQKEGIKFLVNQETRIDATPPFYKLRQYGRVQRWYCGITQSSSVVKPQPVRGSILADEMGLGKTIQTLGLILLNPPRGQQYPIEKKRLTGTPRCTLIVCPLSVISNWQIQIDQFANVDRPDTLKVAIYHGPSRGMVLQRINELDVILTTYNTLASDFQKWEEQMGEESAEEEKVPTIADVWKSSKNRDEDEDFTPGSTDDEDEDDHEIRPKKKRRKSEPAPVIFDEKFHRIVLDEAHTIRNSKTAFFKAIDMLESVYKLALTGTPFVNRPSDIQALLAFIGVNPLDNKNVFTRAVVIPIMEKREIGLARIRVAMSHVALRRTKAQVDSTLALVEKVVEIRHLEFPPGGSHKPIHDLLYDVAREAFIGLLREGTRVVYRNFFHLLSLILRVRMSCCHGALVPPDVVSRMRLAHDELCELRQQKTAGLTAKDGEDILLRILEILKGGQDVEEPSNECAVCFNEMEEGTCVALKKCKHIFCEDCLSKVRNSKCPFCRVSFSSADMIKKDDVVELVTASKSDSTTSSEEENKEDAITTDVDNMERSPKIQAMFDIFADMAPDEKAVVFSQWTSHLDKIQKALEEEGHTFTRIDGSKSPSDRLDAIKSFSTEGTDSQETPRFILLSLHAAGTGLNLTRANVCIMMDCWYNFAIENQAIDRVHRIGQTRPVRAYRLIMKDTLEERMIKVQENKTALGKGSMQKLTLEERRLAKLTALKDLFAVDDEEENWQGVYDHTYENDPEWRG